jgi:hypothetical protein
LRSAEKTGEAPRFLVITIGLPSLLVAIWYVGGKRLLENLVKAYSQPWAGFQVPANPTILTGLEAKLSADSVTVCNRSRRDWNNVGIQVDQGYLASLDRVRDGECKQIFIHDFASDAWKRMPKSGFAKQPLLDTPKANPTSRQ